MTSYHPYGTSEYLHPVDNVPLADYLVSGIPIMRNMISGEKNAVEVIPGSKAMKSIGIGVADSIILPRAISYSHARELKERIVKDLLEDLDLVKQIAPFIPEGYVIRKIIASNELLVGMTIDAQLFVSIGKPKKEIVPLTADQIEKRNKSREKRIARKQQELADFAIHAERMETTDKKGNVVAVKLLTTIEADTQAQEYLNKLAIDLQAQNEQIEKDAALVASIEKEMWEQGQIRLAALTRLRENKERASENPIRK